METIVRVREGQLEGCRSADQKSIIFKGVPYAEPPVGALRWKRPQPKTPWTGVRPAVEFSAKAHQADLTREGFYAKEFYTDEQIERSEDCLYLNIWAPADAQPGDKLPVFFWVHGGAFLHGCGTEKEFDGEQFARNGVILVTINYRVGALGFFAHPDLASENLEGISGNYGIYDQIAALTWCRQNIASFGGDPDNITAAGQSAGCMSVQTILSSPLARGMARGAILQSGGGIQALHTTPGKQALWEVSQRLMDHLGVSTLEELRQVPAGKLRDAAYAVQGQGLSWCPHVDGWLLPDTTDAQAESGAIHDIATMIGSTGDDIGGAELLQGAGARWCENQLKLGRRPAYLYFFDRKLPGDQAGAFHSSELWYEFETLSRGWRPWEEHDWELAGQLSAYWANFVKTGDPNGPGLPPWHPYAGEHKEAMVLR